MIKKFSILGLASAILISCGDSTSSLDEDEAVSSSSDEFLESSTDAEKNSSSSKENLDSSSSEATPKSSQASNNNGNNINESDMISFTTSERFSFFDEKNLRYYFLDEDCLYDSLQNKFIWQTNEFKDIFDDYRYLEYEEGDSLKYEIQHSFGFRISNDTLYECDYFGDSCDETSKAQSVYVGNPGSIFGNWTLVGRIYNGKYTSVDKFTNMVLTLASTGRTVKSSLNLKYYKSIFFCSAIRYLFKQETYDDQCEEYFVENFENFPDTVVFSNDFWMTQKTPDIMTVSIKNNVFDVAINLAGNNNQQVQAYEYTVTSNGISCSYMHQSIDLDKQFCESASPNDYEVEYDYSNISRTNVPMLINYKSNEDEFETCIKQFGFE